MTRAKTRRLYRWIIIGAAVIAVLAGAYFSKRAYHVQKDRVMSVFAAEARSAVLGIDSMFEGMIKTFNEEVPKMEAFLSEKERTDGEITAYLESRARWLSTSVNAMYINLYGAFRGKYLCGNYWSPPEGYDFTPRPWYDIAVKADGETAIVPPYSPLDYPHQLMAVSRRLRYPDCVLSMDIELSALEPIASETLGGSGGHVFFFSPDGAVISPANSPSLAGRDLRRIIAAIDEAQSWCFVLDGEYVFHSRSCYGWRMVRLQDRADIEAPAYWAITGPILWSILGFAMVFLVVEILRYRIDSLANRERGSVSRGNFAQYTVLLSATLAFVGIVWLGQRQLILSESRLATAAAELSVLKASAPFVSYIETARGAASYCAKHVKRMMDAGATDAELAALTKELICTYRSQHLRNYRNIYVARADWYVDSIGWKLPPDYRPADHDFYRDAIARPLDSVFTKPYTSVIDGTEQFSISQAVGDLKGTVVGIDISVKMLQTLVRSIRLDGALCAATISGDGYIIERHDIGADADTRRSLDLRKIAAEALETEGSFRTAGPDGQPLRVISVELPIGGRVIVIGDERMLSTALSTYRGKTLSVVVVVFIVAAFFVFLGMHRIRRRREREIILIEREKNREEKESLLSAVGNQCISVFDVDLKSGLYTIVKRPATTAVMDRKDRRWDLALGRDLAEECLDETKEIMRKLGSVSFLRRELATADHREFYYRHCVPVGGTVERRCTVIPLERNQYGAAVRALVDFMAVDDEAVKLRKQLEEAVKRAESANQAKTTFLFNMSHDIRTPLNAIIGFTEMAKQNLDDPGRLRDCISKIDGSGQLLLSLVNHVLNMSHIEDGKVKPEDGTVSRTDAPARKDDVNPGRLKGKRILLVDDNPLNREVAAYLLKAYGSEVDTAENGREAVEKVKKSLVPSPESLVGGGEDSRLRTKDKGLRTYDFVLMDIQMPVMDGYEATREIRTWEKSILNLQPQPSTSTSTSHLPIIALSANAFEEDRAASRAAGMDDHVAKPVKISEILEVLARFERK